MERVEITDYDIVTGEPYRAVYIEHGTHAEIRPLPGELERLRARAIKEEEPDGSPAIPVCRDP